MNAQQQKTEFNALFLDAIQDALKQEKLNRDIVHIEIFKGDGTFKAYYEAYNKLKDYGYMIGSMCGDSPIGFKDIDVCSYISKWYNMDSNDKTLLDGVMISTDFREGEVYIVFFNQPKYIQPKYEQDKTTKTMNKIETAIEEVANGHEIYTRNEVVAMLKKLSEPEYSKNDVMDILSMYKDELIEHLCKSIEIDIHTDDLDITNFELAVEYGNKIKVESFDVKFTDVGSIKQKVEDAIYEVDISKDLSERTIYTFINRYID